MIIFCYFTHIFLNLSIYIFFARVLKFRVDLIAIAVITIYALLPDIDHPYFKLGRKMGITSYIIYKVFGHRGVFHSVLFSFILSSPFLLLQNDIYFWFAFWSYNMHLAADILTISKIPIFYPFKKRVSLGYIKTGSSLEYFIALMLMYFVLTG